MISNAGRTFQRSFADEPLLERLRIAATSPATDPDVKKRLKELFAQWAVAYKDVQGLQSITILYKQFPQRKKPARPTPAAAASNSSASNTALQSPSSPASSRAPPSLNHAGSSALSKSMPTTKSSTTTVTGSSSSSWSRSHKKSKSKVAAFNLEKEKPQINQALANSSVAATNLTNALKHVNREKERPSEKPEIVKQYEQCQHLRKIVQRYIELIESEQWLGSLIHTHEELSLALERYEIYDKSIEEDSDSEDEWDSPEDETTKRIGKMRITDDNPPPPPPRPVTKEPEFEEEEEEDEDPDNPFGNKYEIVGHEEEIAPGEKW